MHLYTGAEIDKVIAALNYRLPQEKKLGTKLKTMTTELKKRKEEPDIVIKKPLTQTKLFNFAQPQQTLGSIL